jgi:benzoylformate decarboxylase
MTSVREATLELFRARGMTTIFGNPGSTELPMLAGLPSDFSYVLGLQEAVVVAMADGYAQASGRVAHANLHTAPGVGNAVGAIGTAQANKAPLLITAGQQVRPQMTMGAMLTNRDATRVPHPYVKLAYEPPRAADVPAALARAIAHAALPPAGPAFVSVPMDDWEAEADDDAVAHAVARGVDGRAGAAPDAVRRLAERLGAARNPVLVVGGQVDAGGAWDAAVALAERCRLPVWAAPAAGAGRIGFPERHPQFRGILAPAIGPLAQMLEGHDLILVVGSAVFPYYPYIPGPLLPADAELVAVTNDPDEAARAPVGEAIVADVRLALEALLAAVPASKRTPPDPRPDPAPVEASDPPAAAAVLATVASVLGDDAVVVHETPSALGALRDRLRLSAPGSYYFTASGGLGFGLPAAIGVQMAQPQRPVLCVLGEGSAQYAITGLWTAVTYGVPVTFLVLRNDEYAILKWFADLEQITGVVPGLELPGLETAAVARAYGMDARTVAGGEELRVALVEALAAPEPRLLEVRVAPGMSPL